MSGLLRLPGNGEEATAVVASAAVEILNVDTGTTRNLVTDGTFRVLEVALYHSLGKLPEPESTHDFFRRAQIEVVQ
jgi:hypothetical protein